MSALLVAGRRARARSARRATLVLAALVIALVVLTLCIGERSYSPAQVIGVLFGQDVPGASFTVGRLRIPRATTGLLVGVAFGLAGSLFQTMLRNPLASPDIIGISYGSSAVAVVSIALFGASGAAVSALGVAGGLLVAVVVYLLSYRGGVLGSRLILTGIAVGGLLVAVIQYALTRADVYKAADALRWLTGSLSSAFADGVPPLAIALVVLVPAALLLVRRVSALQLGDDSATALGVPAERTRLLVLLVGVALISVATASAGPIAFVAFLSGPIAGRLVRGAPVILPAALVGAALVLGADFVGAHLLPTTMPVGVITGIVGAPYLLWLLSRSSSTGGRP